MKRLKNIFCLITLLCLSLTVFSSKGVFALGKTSTDGQNAQIISTEASPEIIKYAITVYPKHRKAAIKNPVEYGLNDCDISQLTLGSPFSIYMYNNEEVIDTGIFYFPVMYNGRIETTLAVTKDIKGNLVSTFSKGFASKLNNILLNNKDKKYRLVNINNELIAVDNNDALFVANAENTKENFKNINTDTIAKINRSIEKNTKGKKYKESAIRIESSAIESIAPDSVISPTDYKYLSVPVVYQYSHPWCWAATCASIIKYLTVSSPSFTAQSVVVYIYGSAVDKGGNVTQDIKAYNHWGLYPYYDSGNATWANTKSELRSGNPIHSLWFTINHSSGHSMVVRGYEYYGDTGDKVYLLMDPNNGYTSVIGQTYSGDCVYIINGSNYYWTESIIGF